MRRLEQGFMAIMIGVVIVIIFNTKYASLSQKFESDVIARQMQIERYSETCSTFIDIMTHYGNDFFLQDQSEDSIYFPYLTYDSKADAFDMNAIGKTDVVDQVGNISGTGPIPTAGRRRDEINLGFQFYPYFARLHALVPNVAWMYYVSNDDFISLYPYVPTSQYRFSNQTKESPYFTELTPEANPSREARWVPLYVDHAGQGLMVTLSSPIYENDTFRGVVCIDLTAQYLSEVLSSDYEGYLVDSDENVIASSKKGSKITSINKAWQMLKCSEEEYRQMEKTKGGELVHYGEYVVYRFEYDKVPWEIVFRVPVWSLIAQSALYTIPTIIICILLVFAVMEAEGRKKYTQLLSNSLNELKSYEQLLENAAKYDSLTAALNRRGFLELFTERVSYDGLSYVPISFLICDIDHFKRFNDTYGHSAGDIVLLELVKFMKHSVREKDAVCRWGGEEFTVMLYNRTYMEAVQLAEELRKGIEEITIVWEDFELKVTMTFGVVEYNYIDSLEEAIAKADQALYQGKEKGRNCVVGYLDILDLVEEKKE